MDTIHKTLVARAAGESPLEYVMSDATVDRYGDVIDASGWQLANFKKNPVALFGHDSNFIVGHWKNVRVEGGKLLGHLELLPSGISERLDEIRAAVEAGVLRAVSVGFRAIASEPLSKGLKYLKQELVECSLVSIPANPNALQVLKSLHLSSEAEAMILGEPAERDIVRRNGASGVSAGTSLRKHKEMNLSEKIVAAEQRVVALRDQLTDHVSKSDDDMDEGQVALTEELNSRIKSAESTLAALKNAEAALATKAAAGVSAPAIQPNRKVAKETKPGEFIVRAAMINVLAHATGKDPDALLERHYPDDERTALVVKAAVSGATTTGTGWAAELVNTAMADFLETLRPVSVYPTLAAAGGGRLAFGPNQGAIKIPSRAATPSIGGSFVGEGAPIPVRKLGLSAITLSPKKMGVISVFSREIARYSTPAIEGLIRQEIIADTALTLDSLLLDATAADAVRPAGLRNGVAGLTPTAGSGANAILADIRTLTAPFDTANAGRDLVLLMNPAQARALALTPGPDGSLGWTNGILPRTLVSNTIPVGRLIMVDVADFVTATGDVPEFELSNETVLHMEDTTPLQIGTVGAPNTVAAPAQSMFQTAQIAVRMILDVSWAMRRTGMVQWMDAVTW